MWWFACEDEALTPRLRGAARRRVARPDANFSSERLHDVYSADLVNTVGNCGSRVTTMIGKYFEGVLPSELDASGARLAAGGVDWPARAAAAAAAAAEAYAAFDLPAAARAGVRLVSEVDGFIQVTEPFKIAKDPARAAELGAILYQCLEALRIAGVILEPVLPGRMGELALALAGGDAAAAAAAAAGAPAPRARGGGRRPGPAGGKPAPKAPKAPKPSA